MDLTNRSGREITHPSSSAEGREVKSMALTLSPMWYGLLRDLRPKAKNKPKASVLGLISPHSPWLVPLGIQATPSFRRQSEPQEDICSLGPQAQRVWREARLAGVGLRWQGGWSVPLCLRHPPPQLPPNSTWPVLLLSIRHNPTLCPLLALPPGPAPTQ